MVTTTIMAIATKAAICLLLKSDILKLESQLPHSTNVRELLLALSSRSGFSANVGSVPGLSSTPGGDILNWQVCEVVGNELLQLRSGSS